MGMDNIRHLVVLMLENRSVDNMAGYLYADVNNRPPINIPPPGPGLPTTYDGLLNPIERTDFWNPTNETFFRGAAPERVFATTQTRNFTVPDPDPEEQFSDITYQLFGPQIPGPGTPNQMRGFLLSYANASNNPADIMQCYSPAQVPVITNIARSYAISDRWYAACPTQTWPNRAFTHLGTSLGKVNNWPYNPFDYNIQTIFNVLEALVAPWGDPITWAVFNDSVLASLTRAQLPALWDTSLDGRFQSLEAFKQLAAEGDLPTYSFVEPSFIFDPNDEHPPHDVRLGEKLIFDVWKAVTSGAAWKETLLVITYDEHGGCYDHAAPPFGAVPPDDASRHGDQGFGFNRFGVRVPTILVSPYIEPGTVFRSTTQVPYDHTSILATLRKWLRIPPSVMLPSDRISAAPTFDGVLTRGLPRTELAEIAAPIDSLTAFRIAMSEPPNDLQKSIVIALESKRLGHALTIPEVHNLLSKFPTRGLLMTYFR
ncbi:MAG: alkaline phosphatase family protein [Candidatus Binataceae bacterium]